MEFVVQICVADSRALVREERSYENHRGSKHRAAEAGNMVQNSGTSTIFSTENCTVITAQTTSTTTLPCGVKKFGNGVVSTDIM